jgi:NADPH:quinone reductase-like Zn-dependent oxidoreductase
MLAAAIDHFGEPHVLRVGEVPVPTLEAHEVLIAVDTAGVASWDADMRRGWWPGGRPPFPLVLGTDGSGVIAAVGSRVRRFKPGETVYAYSFANSKGGFYAQYVAVPADATAHPPDILDLLHAGAVPAIGLTALQGVDDMAHVRAAQSIIIHGASGGVGHVALQFAKRRGARVLASASGHDGVALVRRLGADVAIDGKHEDILEAARQFAPHGVDAILAFAGGETLERALDAVREGGKLVYPIGVEPEPKRRKGIDVITYDGEAGVRQFEKLGRAIEEANLTVNIHRSYPLAAVVRAHEQVEQGHIHGKIVLRIN